MREYVFETKMWLAHPREQVFGFFSSARNLQRITPEFLSFTVLTPEPIEMRVGTMIDYALRIRGFPVHWRTLISAWGPPGRFVDEQLRRPYRQWIHEHTFEEHDGGTLMRDRVRYAVPFDWLVHRWIVRPDIERIFQFRAEKITEIFPPVAVTSSMLI